MSQHRSQQEWLRLVQLYYSGEQPAAQSCLEHNLHPKTFDNNRRKLRHLVNMPKNEKIHILNSLSLTKQQSQTPKSSNSQDLRYLLSYA